MNIKTSSENILNQNTQTIVLGVFDKEEQSCNNLMLIDNALENSITKFIINDDFKPKFLSSFNIPTFGKISAKNILLIGLGKEEEFSIEKLREVSMEIAKKIKKSKNITISLPINRTNELAEVQAITEGLILGSYKFDKYKSEKEENLIETITICVEENTEDVILASKKGEIFANATNYARNLSNEPAQVATPTKLAELAQNIPNIECKILEAQECEEMGMGAFLAVGKGSSQPPKFIHMSYKCGNPSQKIALIGKGITFDSGGYDIKPASSMINMKDDMSGAAAILGIMNAVAELKPNIEVHGIIAACENMVSGKSYKPGDILTAMNGKTIEVDNTDAEGRLTLADALCYAENLNVDKIIDVATLTGACLVALGHFASGIMGNNNELIEEIQECAQKVGENYWQLPLWDEHMDSLKSDIADMKNTGSRYGGASVAAAFLNNFVKDTKWAHLDVAATAFLEKPYKGFSKGGTGVSVRTLLELVTK